mmetsp:Transcript_87233/g.177817  ORF Transcript_87233/g.177817 Transcript_87233/m.177817 type:complete len:336 (+) Transcript_87233:26-1033(+)
MKQRLRPWPLTRNLVGPAGAAKWPISAFQQLDVERQRSIARNVGRRAARAIAEPGGDKELPLLPHPHAVHAQVPTLDDLAGAELETNAALVEALAVGGQAALITHLHRATSASLLRSSAGLDHFVLQSASQGRHLPRRGRGGCRLVCLPLDSTSSVLGWRHVGVLVVAHALGALLEDHAGLGATKLFGRDKIRYGLRLLGLGLDLTIDLWLLGLRLLRRGLLGLRRGGCLLGRCRRLGFGLLRHRLRLRLSPLRRRHLHWRRVLRHGCSGRGLRPGNELRRHRRGVHGHLHNAYEVHCAIHGLQRVSARGKVKLQGQARIWSVRGDPGRREFLAR